MSSASTDRRWLALVLLAAAQFVVVLDASIVNVALPVDRRRRCDFSQDNLSWVVNAYTLTFGGFLLLGGRMADLLGRRRMFIAGLILFAGASLAGGLAQSDVWLIAARAVQGLGAALLSPAALSLVTDALRRRRRAQQGAGRVGRGRRLRRRGGRAARRHAHRVGRLGVGAVRQRADRHRRGAARAAPAARVRATRARATSTSPARSRVTAGLSLLVYSLVNANAGGLGLGRRRSCCSALALVLLVALRADRAAHARRRWCRSRASSGIRTIRGINITGAADRDGAVLDVLLHLALHAAGARLRRARGRPRLPAAGGAGSSSRRASRRTWSTRFGVKPVLIPGLLLTAIGLLLVLADLGRRHLRRRHPVPVADLGLRPRASRSCR